LKWWFIDKKAKDFREDLVAIKDGYTEEWQRFSRKLFYGTSPHESYTVRAGVHIVIA